MVCFITHGNSYMCNVTIALCIHVERFTVVILTYSGNERPKSCAMMLSKVGHIIVMEKLNMMRFRLS